MSEMNQAPSGQSNKATYIWMSISFVLLILCIVFALFNPFAKSASGESETVATVNGVKITKDDVFNEIYPYIGEQVVETMITEELLRSEAASNNVEVNDSDVDAELERLATSQGMSVEQMLQFFAFQGIPEDEMRDEMKRRAILRGLLSSQIGVTDEEIEQYYNDNIARFTTPEQVRASHILVKTKEEAEEIIDLLNEGADFAELASERGTDATVETGGDLDYFSRGRMVKEFEDASFAMEVGEITQEPVATTHGFHVIMKTDHQPEKVDTLEEAKEDARMILEDQKLDAQTQSWLAEIRQNANITYADRA